MATLDWSQCPAVESVPAKVSGAWVFKGTRMPVQTVFLNRSMKILFDNGTPRSAAEFRSHHSPSVLMLHLRARGFAPVTIRKVNHLIS